MAAGGVSLPVALLIVYVAKKVFGIDDMNDDVVAGISTVVGSATTALTICFWDIRAIILKGLGRRRSTDKV